MRARGDGTITLVIVLVLIALLIAELTGFWWW